MHVKLESKRYTKRIYPNITPEEYSRIPNVQLHESDFFTSGCIPGRKINKTFQGIADYIRYKKGHEIWNLTKKVQFSLRILKMDIL